MSDQVQTFIDRWRASGAAEQANFPLFATELCDLIGVEQPQPKQAIESDNAYVFEKSIPSPHGTTTRIDLYKRGCFVLEAKQGSDQLDAETKAGALSAGAQQRQQKSKKGTAVRGTGGWDTALEKARQQGARYIRNLPPEELVAGSADSGSSSGSNSGGRPPFLIVVDVGYTIDLYAEFTRTGGHYAPFPSPTNYRIHLDDLHKAETRDLLRQIWTDPQTLDPAQRSARVTREIADRLARLAKSLEGKHDPQLVASFLMRSLFTMFAEDVDLLPEKSFTNLLTSLGQKPENFQPMVEHLWETMNRGGFSVILEQQIPHFNGGLFEEVAAVPLNAEQIELLREAAQADWRDVEPAIFGTLLERALDPVERHKLGAHYTPRAYVERLVEPTVMEPLRAEWEAVQTAALLLADEEGRADKAQAEINGFLNKLATTRVLDPACGSGNFLYVTLAKMKELEAEVLEVRRKLGGTQMALEIESVRVTPRQFLGIEVNPRAAAIAELVLWIGYLQWHLRTNGSASIPDPVLQAYHNIECRDAVLAWDDVEPLLDDDGQPVTRWDGRTTKTHPVTGEEVPDDTARIPAYKYINPREAEWPEAEYIVGNPPFIGATWLLQELGEDYAKSIRSLYSEVAASSDYVMYWWYKAAKKLARKTILQFGFIATNSLRQTLNRKVLEKTLGSSKPISLIFAIPDHPWVDDSDGAAVRISMTVARFGDENGRLLQVVDEEQKDSNDIQVEFDESRGKIGADLRIGADVTNAIALKSQHNISSRGFELGSSGFIVTPEQAETMGRNSIPNLKEHILPYRNGRDVAQTCRNVMAIDLHGLTENEVRTRFPQVYQWIVNRVKPDREQNRDRRLREFWWLHRRSRDDLRNMLNDISRFISTVETSKHRFFVFLDKEILPDNKLVNIALEDGYFLGVLSSRIHVIWVLAAGSTLEDRPVYVKTTCFETFPFPDPTEDPKVRIRDLAEQLDAHRKRQQALHPKLTLTNMYNVLEKLRAEEELTAKEQATHEQGLVSILKQIHDELDVAVFEAYGWPTGLNNDNLSDEEILERLVALNAERAAEEANGHVCWLRPDYQAPDEVAAKEKAAEQGPVQQTLVPTAEPTIKTPAVATEKQAWPGALADQAQAIRTVLSNAATPLTVDDVASIFTGRKTQKRLGSIESLLETLVALGQAEVGPLGDGVEDVRFSVV